MNLFDQKIMHDESKVNGLNLLKILLIVTTSLFISACGNTENNEQTEGVATLSVTIPGLTASKQGHKPGVALRAGVPAEVTSILIEVLNDKAVILDSAEVVGTDGTVVLTIIAGENYTIRGSAFAGNELLFQGETIVDIVKAGSSSSVSLTLDDQIQLSLTSPGDIEIGVGETSINFNLSGLTDTALRWYVNGVVGGSSEYGLINEAGVYSPPATLPTNPVITITAEPIVSPSFSQSFSFDLLPTDKLNNNPVANAGADQSVIESMQVLLDGSVSNDNDGTIDSYSWALITGSGITLNNATTATPDFTAPLVSSSQVFVFQLSVSDNEGATSSDTVSITVGPLPNIVPVANAGIDQTVNAGDVVTLSAAASSDADGTVVSYSWLQLSEDVFPVINNTNQSTASFDAPSLSRDSVVIVEVTVTDNEGAIDTDTVTILILRVPNENPMANAGVDQTVDEQSTVVLNGSNSTDSDGTVNSYSWLQTLGTSVSLSDSSIATPDFTAPKLTVNEDLQFDLTVTDNDGASHTDSVLITVQPVNADPVADAGGDITVNAAVVVNLSAAASNDSDGSIATYNWVQISNDLNPSLSNADTSTPSFTAPSIQYGGFVTYRLTVSDNEGANATDEVTVTVNGTDQPLVSNAGPDQVVDENTMVTLDGSASNDPDNVINSYLWEELSAGGLVLSNSAAAMPTFNAPDVIISTDYQFRLTVTNDHGDQVQDTITVTVNDVLVSTGNVYFAATTGFNDHTIWVTDGTDSGTQQVAAVQTSNSDFRNYKTIGDYFYFSGNDGVNGFELWRTDGTLVGTEMLPSAPDSAYLGLEASANASPVSLNVLNDLLLYRANTSFDGTFYYPEYVSLNTTNDILTTVSSAGINSFSPEQVGTFEGFSYYFEKDSSAPVSSTLYKTDGINPSIVVLTISQYGDFHDFTEVNGELFFVFGSNQLWKTDSSGVGNVLVKTFSGQVAHSNNTLADKNMISFNNQLFFLANNGEGEELWKSDGTIPGTVLVEDLDASPASSDPTAFGIVNGRLLFLSSEAGASTDGLWVTDGTAVGTERIASLSVNSDINYYDGMETGISLVVNSLNLMFFTANDGINGNELWATDGTAPGTRLVRDINTTGDSEPAMFREGNGFLIFSAQDENSYAKLWRTDGTESGTILIQDINPVGIGNSAFFFVSG